MADSEHVPLRVAAGRVASLPKRTITAFCTDAPASEQAAVIANAVRCAGALISFEGGGG